jgi:hypothetical protein
MKGCHGQSNGSASPPWLLCRDRQRSQMEEAKWEFNLIDSEKQKHQHAGGCLEGRHARSFDVLCVAHIGRLKSVWPAGLGPECI